MAGFGDMLRRYRRKAGLSQRELARRVGVDFSYISKLENSRLPSPAAETVLRLAVEIGCSPEDLLAAAKKMPSGVNDTLTSDPAAIRFLQEASQLDLSQDEWQQLTGSLHDLRRRLEGAADA